MDISIAMNGTRLNLRVAVLLKTRQGYVFERGDTGYFFPVGGRIKINEDSKAAAIREVKEEIGEELSDLRLIGVIENFFDHANEHFHELCFLYKAEVEHDVALPPRFHYVSSENFSHHDIRPVVVCEFANVDDPGIRHRVLKY